MPKKPKDILWNPQLGLNDSEFLKWYSKNTLEGQKGIPHNDPNMDYDFYSYYKNTPKRKLSNPDNHFPDTYKLPNHETFSNESLYSIPENPGGSWENNEFIPMKKKKFLLGGALYGTAKAFGANDTIANALGTAGGIGEMFFNPISGGVETAKYGSQLAVKELMAYGGSRKNIYAYGGNPNEHLFNEYNGPKHEDGGVTISQVAETEGGENEYKGYIFSNRVKAFGGKKTYSEEASKIFSKYKNRLTDKISLESLDREMNRLMAAQESDSEILKGRESVNQKFAYGGKKKMAFGDPPLNLTGAGLYGTPLSNSLMEQPLMQNNNQLGFNLLQSNIYSDNTGEGYGLSTIERANLMNPDANINFASKDSFRPIVKENTIINPNSNIPSKVKQDNLSPINSNVVSNSNQPFKSQQLPNENIPVTGALLNSIGPMSQLMGTLINGADKTQFDRVSPSLVNYNPAITLANRQADLGKGNMRASVLNNASSSGQLLSNLVGGDVGITKNLNDLTTNLKMQEANTNSQLKTQANSQNAQIQMQERIANEQNKAAYRQAIYGALTDLGNIGAGYIKDNALLDSQTLQNQRTLNMLSGLPSRYSVDINGNIITK